MRKAGFLAVFVVFVASIVMTASAYANGETAQVTTNTDTGSTSGCELRDAITAVTTNTSPVGGCTTVDTSGTDDHVTFAPSMSGQTIVLSAGELAINDSESDFDITGPGMNQLTVSGNDASRVFLVNSPNLTSITGLSLVHGNAPVVSGQAQGGAIESQSNLTLNGVKLANSASTVTASSPTHLNADGAGIHAIAPLTLNQSVVTGNTVTATQTATGANDTAEARGGGIFAEDALDLTDSTVSGNTAAAVTAGMSAAQATGGIRSDTRLEMTGSTISGNVASATSTGTPGSANARGGLLEQGGINVSPGVVEQSTIAGNKADATAPTTAIETGGMDIDTDTNIRTSTIALNGPDAATVDGANIRITGGSSVIENSIVADPRGGGTNCSGDTFTSDGFNDDYSPTATSCLTAPVVSDTTANPLLATAGLQANGGLTQTIALQPTSPMIDAGSNADLSDPSQDQRGAAFLRPVDFPGLPNAGNGTDIGAFEFQSTCTGQAVPNGTCPGPPDGGGGGGSTNTPPPAPPVSTGLRAKALKKCKKIKPKNKSKAKKRRNCLRRAKKLPV